MELQMHRNFFKIVDSCKGHVELLTGEGDRLNSEIKAVPVYINDTIIL